MKSLDRLVRRLVRRLVHRLVDGPVHQPPPGAPLRSDRSPDGTSSAAGGPRPTAGVAAWLVAAVVAGLIGIPAIGRAQQAPLTDDFYSAMPPPAAAPSPYLPAPPVDSPPYSPQAPTRDDEVGYDDAGAAAAAQVASEYDAGYVDDGWDAEAYTDYEATLSPYGSWVNTADYGRVWAPSVSYVGVGFLPYSSGGHWALTQYGWTWVSDWDWGWAPFHYGRWFTVGNYGWCWRPGRVWGPAWVGWRYGGGYVGWAPLPPRGLSIPPPPAGGGQGAWRFTTVAGLSAARPAYVPAAQARSVWSGTAPLRNVQTINAYHVEAGPHPQLVAQAVGHPIQTVGIHAFPAAAPRATIVPRTPPVATFATRSPTAVGDPSARSAPAGIAPGVSSGYRGGTPAPPVPWHATTPSYASPGHPAQPAPAARPPSYGAPIYHPSAPLPSAAATPGYRGGAASSEPADRAPTYSPPAYHPTPSYSPPAYHAAPSMPSYSPPAYHAAPSMPSYSPPAYHAAPSTPSYSPPAYHAAPSVPSYSPPAYHAPAPSFAPPARPSYSPGAVARPASPGRR